MSLNDIIGQDIPVKSIKNMMREFRIRGAYLFLGPDRDTTNAGAFRRRCPLGNERGARNARATSVPI